MVIARNYRKTAHMLDRTKLLEAHATAGVGAAYTAHPTSIRLPGGRMTSRVPMTMLAILVALTVAACSLMASRVRSPIIAYRKRSSPELGRREPQVGRSGPSRTG